MGTSTSAARELAVLAHESRRQRTAIVRQVVAAYRPLRPDLPANLRDIDLLGHLAEDLKSTGRPS